jgi:ribosomal protein S18 acetylase RimI-like enzyme
VVELRLSDLPEGVRLRPIREEDNVFLYRLYASTRASEMALLDWSDEQKSEFLTMQFRAQSDFYTQQFKQASFDVIEREGNAIGRLYVDRRPDEIRIIDIALMPECRGKGIGGGIMQALLDEAAEENKSVTIHVEHNNPAMHLYQRLGFRHVSDEGVYYLMEWRADGRYVTGDQENTAS